MNEHVRISIEILLKFCSYGSHKNIPTLVPIMAWRRPGDKSLSETMVVSLLTYICVTLPQWVNTSRETTRHAYSHKKSSTTNHVHFFMWCNIFCMVFKPLELFASSICLLKVCNLCERGWAVTVNSSSPGQNVDIFKCIFLNEKVRFLTKLSLKFFP